MRIVGGENRGRILSSLAGVATRPTSDRARQSIFNILEHGSWIPHKIMEAPLVLDIFAGTGALGLEALSRGAAHAVFIEKEAPAAAVCQKNIQALGFDEKKTHLMRIDALSPPVKPLYIAPRNLVFLDPPYGQGLAAKALSAFTEKNWLEPGAICVVEMSRKEPEDMPAGFTQHDSRTYGIAQIDFLTWEA